MRIPGTAGADCRGELLLGAKPKITSLDGGSYLMPMLDFEFSLTDAPRSHRVAMGQRVVPARCRIYAAASNGVTSSIRWCTHILHSPAPTCSSTVTQWPLWMASPNGVNPQTGDPNTTSPWGAWTLWQYGQADIPGITTGVVDEDVFDGTAAELTNSLVIGKAIASAGSRCNDILGSRSQERLSRKRRHGDVGNLHNQLVAERHGRCS